MTGRETLGGCQALPVAIFFVLHFVEGREFADGLIHEIACIHYTGTEAGYGLNGEAKNLAASGNAGVLRYAQNDQRFGYA